MGKIGCGTEHLSLSKMREAESTKFNGVSVKGVRLWNRCDKELRMQFMFKNTVISIKLRYDDMILGMN